MPSSYRVPATHAATIAHLTALANAAGFKVRISWVPFETDSAPRARERGYDGVWLYIGVEEGPHREHAVVAWCNTNGYLSANPGVPLTLDQVPPYLSAYRERMKRDRHGIGGDGLDTVYHAVTGRSAYGQQPRYVAAYVEPTAADQAPAPAASAFTSGWAGVLAPTA